MATKTDSKRVKMVMVRINGRTRFIAANCDGDKVRLSAEDIERVWGIPRGSCLVFG
jgi:hypothetical protein